MSACSPNTSNHILSRSNCAIRRQQHNSENPDRRDQSSHYVHHYLGQVRSAAAQSAAKLLPSALTVRRRSDVCAMCLSDCAKFAEVILSLGQADRVGAAGVVSVTELGVIILPKTNRTDLKCSWRRLGQSRKATAYARVPFRGHHRTCRNQYWRPSAGRNNVRISSAAVPTTNSFVRMLY